MGIPKKNHAVRPEADLLKVLMPRFPSLDDADKIQQNPRRKYSFVRVCACVLACVRVWFRSPSMSAPIPRCPPLN